jgi:cell division protein FtsI (penicillin-binding protein 3)
MLVALGYRSTHLALAGESEAGGVAINALRQGSRCVPLYGRRGDIVDRHGRTLVRTVERADIFVNPKDVTNPKGTARLIAEAAELDPADLLEALRANSTWSKVVGDLTATQAHAVEERSIRALHVIRRYARVFPNGDEFLRPVLGITNEDEETGGLAGAAGLELTYTAELTGELGEHCFLSDANGRPTPAQATPIKASTPGKHLRTTIDADLQAFFEHRVDQALEEFRAASGVGIVLHPSTGAVMAMVNRTGPGTKGDGLMVGENRSVALAYDPGSIMKIVAVAGALEDGVVTPDTLIDVPTRIPLAEGRSITNVHDGAPQQTVANILVTSSNTGTVQIARKLGEERFRHYLAAFGFGNATGIDLPVEADGLLTDDWRDSTLPTYAIGQGITASALQMALAYGVIANDGVRMPPHLGASLIAADGSEVDIEPKSGHRVISQETARVMRVLLREVVSEEAGTGGSADVPGYEVGGKTGTPRIVGLDGLYMPSNVSSSYHGSFVGFAPGRDPEFVVLVRIENPENGEYYGGVLAAPVFSDVVSQLMAQHGIAPDDEQVASETAISQSRESASTPTTAVPTKASKAGKNSSVILVEGDE